MSTQNDSFTVCIRCGKTRIFSKTWKDKGENQRGSAMTYVQTVCPDPECQKIVDEKFQKMRELRLAAENRKKDIVVKAPAAVAAEKIKDLA